ncbi:MAG: hypothetical protein Fur0040_02050 [Sideroxydans sp.]
MDKKTVFIKTEKGESELPSMSGEMRRVMLLIDDKSTLEEVTKRAPPSLRSDLPELIQRLLDAELIADKDKAANKIAAPKIVTPKIATPKSSAPAASEELDFTTMFKAPSPAELAAEGARLKAQQAAEAEKARAEQDARNKQAELAAERARQAAEAARLKAEQEAARIKAELEAAARAKAEAEAARVRVEAEAARVKAELEAARLKAEQEAAARAKAEAEARALAEERARQEAEAARMRAEQEAAARARAEAEERARQEAEAARMRAEQEAARLKAEQEAERIKAEQIAAARAQAEAEERARQEAEAARIRAEAEALRIKAEEETARVKAELEAARARAEAEARALAEERARQQAETARLKAEQEAVARAKEAEEQARQEAEAARIRAEQEASRLKAEQEAAAAVKGGEAIPSLAQAAAAAQGEATQAAQPATSPWQITLNLDALNTAPGAQAAATEPQSVAPSPSAGQQTEAKTEAAPSSQQQAQQRAEEMARLKAEQEQAKLRAEQEARTKEEEQALAAEQASAWTEAEQRAKMQAELEAAQAAQQAALHQAKAMQQPVAQVRRAPLPWGKILLGLLVLAIAAVLVLPMVWPLQEFVPAAEQHLSAQVGMPVRVESMRAAVLPRPSLKLENVRMGSNEEIKVTALVLNLDPLSLLAEHKTISDAEWQGISADGKQLGQWLPRLKNIGANSDISVRHMTFRQLQLTGAGFPVPSLSGSAELAQGAFARVVLHSEDDKLNVELSQQQGGWRLAFTLREMALPLLPAIQFSDFSAKGLIADGGIDFGEIDAHAYGGIWSGRGKLTWRKGWQLQGRMQAKTMELDKLFPQTGHGGELFVEGNYVMQAATLAQLGETLRLDGSFSAQRGVLAGVDMVETARLGSHEHLPGGRTNFDGITGQVQLENRAVRFRQVKIQSGMLTATGAFEVSPNQQLTGSFDAEIKMRSGVNRLLLSGTFEEPRLVAQ